MIKVFLPSPLAGEGPGVRGELTNAPSPAPSGHPLPQGERES